MLPHDLEQAAFAEDPPVMVLQAVLKSGDVSHSR